MADLCIGGVWLLHDFLDESHDITQTVKTSSGSYWHGIMHRREPDYSNSKYWFRQTGEHPVFAPLGEAARSFAAQSERSDLADQLTGRRAWDPFLFIDLCEAVARGAAGDEALCRRIQQREWELLFDYCYRAAVSL